MAIKLQWRSESRFFSGTLVPHTITELFISTAKKSQQQNKNDQLKKYILISKGLIETSFKAIFH